MPKPIENIQEDIQILIFSVVKIQSDIKEINLLIKELISNKSVHPKNLEVKKTGWFYG